jgi:hypothetical protein
MSLDDSLAIRLLSSFLSSFDASVGKGQDRGCQIGDPSSYLIDMSDDMS